MKERDSKVNIINYLNEKKKKKMEMKNSARKRRNFFSRILDFNNNNNSNFAKTSHSKLRIFYTICEFLDIYSLENLDRYLRRYMGHLKGWEFVVKVEKSKKMITVKKI